MIVANTAGGFLVGAVFGAMLGVLFFFYGGRQR